MIGFFLGLCGLLTNPVPGPRATERQEQGVQAWRTAVDRLEVKRNWVMASLVFELAAVGAIVYLAAQVF